MTILDYNRLDNDRTMQADDLHVFVCQSAAYYVGLLFTDSGKKPVRRGPPAPRIHLFFPRVILGMPVAGCDTFAPSAAQVQNAIRRCATHNSRNGMTQVCRRENH
jgi:hypothetical protein